MDYDQSLKRLEEKYPDQESKDIIHDWGKRLKLASLTANLRNHAGMKMLLDSLESELVKIKKELMDNDKLFKDEEGIQLGRLLHERKKWLSSFLKVFDRAENQIKGITNLIDKKLLDENTNS